MNWLPRLSKPTTVWSRFKQAERRWNEITDAGQIGNIEELKARAQKTLPGLRFQVTAANADNYYYWERSLIHIYQIYASSVGSLSHELTHACEFPPRPWPIRWGTFMTTLVGDLFDRSRIKANGLYRRISHLGSKDPSDLLHEAQPSPKTLKRLKELFLREILADRLGIRHLIPLGQSQSVHYTKRIKHLQNQRMYLRAIRAYERQLQAQ